MGAGSADHSGHLGGTTALVREPNVSHTATRDANVSQKRGNIDTFCGRVVSIDISLGRVDKSLFLNHESP
jgi:hypothetical protein